MHHSQLGHRCTGQQMLLILVFDVGLPEAMSEYMVVDVLSIR